MNLDSAGAWIGPSLSSAVSADGRWVALTAAAMTWLRDVQLGTTEAITLDPQGVPILGIVSVARHAISADGRFVAFNSPQPGFIPDDGNGANDSFLRDRRPFFTDLGQGLAGAAGTPSLDASGPLLAGATVTLALADAAPLAPSALIVGLTAVNAPFKGGTLVPQPLLLLPLATSAAGEAALASPWPSGIPADTLLFFHWWIADAAGPAGLAASNALSALAP